MLKRKGFTLVELMIVITIIGILATIVVASFTRINKQARDTKRKGDLRALSTALQVYFNEQGSYPASGGLSVLTPLYIPQLPKPPPGGTISTAGYSYNSSANPPIFALCADLEAVGGANTYWKVSTLNSSGYNVATLALCTVAE